MCSLHLFELILGIAIKVWKYWVRKIKKELVAKKVLNLHLKKQDSSTGLFETSQNVSFFVFIFLFFPFGISSCMQWFFDSVKNQASISKYLLELIKRRLKAHRKNMSSELALNFDQWKTFSEIYKPIRIRLWSIEYNYRSRLYVKFIQTQKRCPTLFVKIGILTSRKLVILSQNFSFGLMSFSITSSLWN